VKFLVGLSIATLSLWLWLSNLFFVAGEIGWLWAILFDVVLLPVSIITVPFYIGFTTGVWTSAIVLVVIALLMAFGLYIDRDSTVDKD